MYRQSMLSKRFIEILKLIKRNFRGMNCLHILAIHCKENAPQILDNLLKHHPTYPLDIQDEQGNTGLFSNKNFFIENIRFFLKHFYWLIKMVMVNYVVL
jgi:hypothetical protein